MPGFVHLHVASGYSLRYGTAQPEALAVRAAELGQDALALTDRDGAYGAVAFALACREVGISPILGADLAVAPQESPVGPPRPRPGAPARGGTSVDPGHPRVVLLARGASGWASLCRVISMAHLTGDRGRPVVTLAGIAEHARGLVALLGPDSDVGRAVARRRPDEAATCSPDGRRRWVPTCGSRWCPTGAGPGVGATGRFRPARWPPGCWALPSSGEWRPCSPTRCGT